MARAIDSETAYQFLTEQLVKETGAFSKGVNKGLNIARSAMRSPDAIPTLTPPNDPLMLAGRLTPKMVTCPKGWKEVRDTRFYCPGCKKAVKKGEAYCHKCGQALIFPAERYDKENNRIWLDFSDRRPPEKEEDT